MMLPSGPAAEAKFGVADPRGVSGAIGAWIGSTTGLLIGPAAVVTSTQGLLMQPLATSFGLSRTGISAVLVISPLVGGLVTALAGYVVDQAGLRRVMLPSVLLFGLAHLLLGCVGTLWQFIVGFTLLSVVAGFHSTVGYVKALTLWFNRRRGLAIGMATAVGSGGGAVIMPQIAYRLIGRFGWHGAFFGLGAIILLVGAPLIAIFLRVPTGQSDARPRAGAGTSMSSVLTSTQFVLIGLMVLPVAMALIGTTIHLFPMLIDHGLRPLIATDALSCVFAGGVAGQISAGLLADRSRSPRFLLGYICGGMLGILLVYLCSAAEPLLLGAFLVGLGTGSVLSNAPFLISRYFGLGAFGSLYGINFALTCIGISSGLLLLGYIRDRAGSYDPMCIVCVLALAVALGGVWLMKPYVAAVIAQDATS